MNRCTSTTAVDKFTRLPSKSDLLSFTTLVSVASRFSRDSICGALPLSAVVSVCRFLMMSTTLPLPSARMRVVCDSCASV
ncbi:Uncharacterised protein [Mycobacterium tuberculosis]|nr:Uncharacterised protein [Mycobacterium tuberculosis]